MEGYQNLNDHNSIHSELYVFQMHSGAAFINPWKYASTYQWVTNIS